MSKQFIRVTSIFFYLDRLTDFVLMEYGIRHLFVCYHAVQTMFETLLMGVFHIITQEGV